MAASLFPLWASSTERITSRSMLGNMSWMAFRSSSLQWGWVLAAAGGRATGTMPGLQTAGIPESRRRASGKAGWQQHVGWALAKEDKDASC